MTQADVTFWAFVVALLSFLVAAGIAWVLESF